jgi:hypothetical protein
LQDLAKIHELLNWLSWSDGLENIPVKVTPMQSTDKRNAVEEIKKGITSESVSRYLENPDFIEKFLQEHSYTVTQDDSWKYRRFARRLLK